MTVLNGVDYSTKISKNLTLADVTLKPFFPHELSASVDFSIPEMIRNLSALSENIIEPLLDQFPGGRLNSVFRKYTKGKSQHEKGMAIDIQWPGVKASKYTEIANWVKDNLDYDQLIMEHGKSIWLHISFDVTKSKQRKMNMTYHPKKVPQYSMGLTNYYA